MGWLYTNKSRLGDKDEYLRRALRCADDAPPGHSNTVLKSAFVGSTWYAALEIKRPDAPTQVVAIIMLTDSSGDQFGYKDMDETSGPYECACPMGIYNLLTPLTPGRYPYAEEWRRNVLAYHAAQADTRKLRANLAGKWVQFETPLLYCGKEVAGGWVSEVQVSRKRKALCIVTHGMFCRIPSDALRTATITTEKPGTTPVAEDEVKAASEQQETSTSKPFQMGLGL